MADGTDIEWTDATWNIINGCTVVSPGCTNCYAMRLAGTRLRNHPSRAGLTIETKTGPAWNGAIRLYEPLLDQPRRWSRPRMIFVCAHGDLGHAGIDDHMLDKVFVAMLDAPQHIYQILTKRPERFVSYFADLRQRQHELACHAGLDWLDEIPTNWWFGISAEDQKRYDERWPVLAQLPAQIRWVSAEPLLGHLDILAHTTLPNWVVAGGESGPGARPMHPDWARSLRDQCTAAGVAFLFKQWGNWISIYDRDRDDPDWQACARPGGWDRKRWLNFAGGQGFHGDKLHMMLNVGKKAAGRLLDGVQHDALPEAIHG